MGATNERAVDLLVPGPIDQRTGGYLYDRRIFAGLEELGWHTTIQALDPTFPSPSASALADAKRQIAELPGGRLVVIDGLALTGLLPLLDDIAHRLEPIALIHHPLALETGLNPARQEALRVGEREALAKVPRVIVTSHWTREVLGEYGVEPARIAVVEPGVDRAAATVRPERPAEAGLGLLSVGSVTPRKGHGLLIDALATIRDRDWSLRIAGSLEHDPATAAALERQIAAQGLSDRVALLGELGPDGVRQEYGRADLFVLASFLEGYGMVVAEAVAHGLPVVATSAGAVAGTLPAGAGILVPTGEATLFATAVAGLCDDRAQLRRLAAGAQAAADTIPDWADSARRFAAALSGPTR